MTITHSEAYFLTWDVGPEVIEMVKKRMFQKYGDVHISEDTQGIHFYAKGIVTAAPEEGNDDRQTLHDTDSTDGDEQRDPGTHGADGYLGLVDDTGSDPV